MEKIYRKKWTEGQRKNANVRPLATVRLQCIANFLRSTSFDIVTTILSLLNKDSPLNDALSHGRTEITECRRTEVY